MRGFNLTVVGAVAVGLMVMAGSAPAAESQTAKVRGLVTGVVRDGQAIRIKALMGATLLWTNLATGEKGWVRTGGPVAGRRAVDAPAGAGDAADAADAGAADAGMQKDKGPSNYWIKKLPVGRYGVRITAPGYYPLMIPVVDVRPGAQRHDFGPLEPLAVSPPPAVAVPAGASGSESAEDPLGASAAGAAPAAPVASPGSDAAAAYGASFVTWQLPPPPAVNRWSYFDVVFLMKNTGTSPWTWGYGSNRIWTAFKGAGFTVKQVLPYTATVGANGNLSIRVRLQATGAPGIGRVQFAVTRNGVPFGNWTPSVNVTIR